MAFLEGDRMVSIVGVTVPFLLSVIPISCNASQGTVAVTSKVISPAQPQRVLNASAVMVKTDGKGRISSG